MNDVEQPSAHQSLTHSSMDKPYIHLRAKLLAAVPRDDTTIALCIAFVYNVICEIKERGGTKKDLIFALNDCIFALHPANSSLGQESQANIEARLQGLGREGQMLAEIALLVVRTEWLNETTALEQKRTVALLWERLTSARDREWMD
jgi:hypothetical protein